MGLPIILAILVAILLRALYVRRRNRIDPSNWDAVSDYMEIRTGVELPESEALAALARRETEQLLFVTLEHADLEAEIEEKRKAILALALDRRSRYRPQDLVLVSVISALKESIEASPRY